MASEQVMNEAIARAVAEATRVAIQTIRTQDRQSCHEATNV